MHLIAYFNLAFLPAETTLLQKQKVPYSRDLNFTLSKDADSISASRFLLDYQIINCVGNKTDTIVAYK